MSRQKSEVVKTLYGEWARGAFDNREPFAGDLDFEMSGWVMLESGTIKAQGIDGMATVWLEVLRAWDDFHAGPIEDLIEVDDQVVVFNRLFARGKQTGIQVNAERAAVFTFREGKITRLFLTDREEALKAVGLSE